MRTRHVVLHRRVAQEQAAWSISCSWAHSPYAHRGVAGCTHLVVSPDNGQAYHKDGEMVQLARSTSMGVIMVVMVDSIEGPYPVCNDVSMVRCTAVSTDAEVM